MGRLIDADKLKNVFDIENETFLPYEIRFIIDGEQTVDAVPVIRCKDCRYAEPTHDTKGRPCYDTIYCERNDLQAKQNWFCADGRKKEGDYGGEAD